MSDEEFKLSIAKLVCCGPNGCMGLIKVREEDPRRCWCEMPDMKRGRRGFIDATVEAISKLYEEKYAG